MARPRLNLPPLERLRKRDGEETVEPASLAHIVRTIRDWGRHVDDELDVIDGGTP
jgi:hypothetical protein